jgi:hypothetical protein
MATPLRLVPLPEQLDSALWPLSDRMTGPNGDSGNGIGIEIRSVPRDHGGERA